MDFDKLYGVVGAFADKKNPKSELNYILVDGGKLVVTDTQLMLIVDYKVDCADQTLLDTGKSTGLKCNTLVAGVPATTEGKFPEYSRVQSKETEVVYTCGTLQEALSLYPHFAQSGEAYIDVMGPAAKFKKLQTVVKKVEVLKLGFSKGLFTLKLTLLSGIKAELIVMPVILGA